MGNSPSQTQSSQTQSNLLETDPVRYFLGPQFTCFKGKSIEWISQHADPICIQISRDEKSLETQSLETKITTLKGMNNTSVANSAYLALHSPEPYNIYARNRFDEMTALIEQL